jgi:3-oxoacyl-[acyl-carrier protein] reductase
MDLGLSGKSAFVSGSNRGTGAVIADSLEAEGVKVIRHSMAQTGDDLVCGDLSNEEGCLAVVDQVTAQLGGGGPDILINNYGTAGSGRWDQLSTEQWLDMFQRNVLSATRLIQGFSGSMKEQQWGRIIQLGTIGSIQPNKVMPHYYASKGALANLTVSLAKELAGSGITVNTVSPGLIHTDEVEAGYRMAAKKHGWGDDWRDIEKQIVNRDFPNPCGRIATRQDVADTVAFIASERASFINGQNIRVDGGALGIV